jgi:putative transposase
MARTRKDGALTLPQRRIVWLMRQHGTAIFRESSQVFRWAVEDGAVVIRTLGGRERALLERGIIAPGNSGMVLTALGQAFARDMRREPPGLGAMQATRAQFWVSDDQMERLADHFPRSHGQSRVDDRRVLSGIIHVLRHGLQWRDAPEEYGPYQTLHTRFWRWAEVGVMDRVLSQVLDRDGPGARLAVDRSCLARHKSGAWMLSAGHFPTLSVI